MALGSWKTNKMVKRYAHHSASSLLPFAQRTDDKLAGAINKTPENPTPFDTSKSVGGVNTGKGAVPAQLRLVTPFHTPPKKEAPQEVLQFGG